LRSKDAFPGANLAHVGSSGLCGGGSADLDEVFNELVSRTHRGQVAGTGAPAQAAMGMEFQQPVVVVAETTPLVTGAPIAR
jgi:hypothetical protein